MPAAGIVVSMRPAVAPRMGESLPRGGRQVSTIMRFCPVYAGLPGSVAVLWSVDRAFPRSTLHQAESLPDHEACRCGPAGHRTPPPQAGPLSQVPTGPGPIAREIPPDITGIGPAQQLVPDNGLFPATPGFDEATGFGSSRMATLITQPR